MPLHLRTALGERSRNHPGNSTRNNGRQAPISASSRTALPIVFESGKRSTGSSHPCSTRESGGRKIIITNAIAIALVLGLRLDLGDQRRQFRGVRPLDRGILVGETNDLRPGRLALLRSTVGSPRLCCGQPDALSPRLPRQSRFLCLGTPATPIVRAWFNSISVRVAGPSPEPSWRGSTGVSHCRPSVFRHRC